MGGLVRLADWLSFAATPSFAVLALVSATLGTGPDICSAGRDGPVLTGMTTMSLLMAVFHARPWLELMVRPR